MMNYLLEVLKLIAKFIYAFLKLLPTQNKVVMISRRNFKTSIDFQMIQDELQNEDPSCKVVILNHRITSKPKHVFEILAEMYHLATSKACIVDSYIISVSILNHKEDLKVIQIWHALGAIKKFGYATLEKQAGVSKEMSEVMNMHKNYTYVISGSKKMIKPFAESFNVEHEIIKPFAMPRVDWLLNKENEEAIKLNIYSEYPSLMEKKNILYAPTFRKGEKIELDDLINNIDYSKFNLILKLHPVDKMALTLNIDREGIIVDNRFDTMEMLFVADHVITDYSAVTFEAAILKKPLYFYAYDLDQYEENCGLYIDFNAEMPGLISKNANDIIKAIENDHYDLEQIELFREKYISDLSGESTKKIVSLIH